MAIADIATILTAVATSIKTACDITKSMSSASQTVAERNKAVSETLGILISVQSDVVAVRSDYYEMLKTKDILEKRIAEFEQWGKTEGQYRLTEVHRGVFVYVPKNPDEIGQPAHWLCANCWQEKKKSILQAEYHHSEAAAYTCQRCKAKITMQFKSDCPAVVRLENKWDAY